MYYLIYEQYMEYNQFEGDWFYQVDEYKDFYEAFNDKKESLKNNNIRNIKLLRDFEI